MHPSNHDVPLHSASAHSDYHNVCQDRDRYVSGEFRFRHGYCKANPRKMVKMWAEKEFRNLARMHACGLPCPKVGGPRDLPTCVCVYMLHICAYTSTHV